MSKDEAMRALTVLSAEGVISSGRAREILDMTAMEQRDFWRREHAIAMEEGRADLRETIMALEDEVAHGQESVILLGEKLSRTIDILKGPPAEDCLHSTHDVPERVEALVKHRDMLLDVVKLMGERPK